MRIVSAIALSKRNPVRGALRASPMRLALVAKPETLIVDEVATRLWNFKEDGIEDLQGLYAEWKGVHNQEYLPLRVARTGMVGRGFIPCNTAAFPQRGFNP